MSESSMENWEGMPAAFPATGAPEKYLRFLLRYAVMAPSNRNVQPWLFKIKDDTVALYADRSRALPVMDPQDRELLIGCGAALFYLRVALRHFGYMDKVETFPDANDPDLLARVRLGSKRTATTEEELLFQAIPKRHTNRFPFKNMHVSGWLLDALQADARSENAWLHIVGDSDLRYAIADLIAEADHAQWSNQEYRSEVAGWVRSNRGSERDGLPGYALGMDDLEAGIAPLVMEAFDLSNSVSGKDYKLAIAAPALVVLGTDLDEPSGWLAAGQALAKVLLHASAEGLSAAFFNQPIEVADMRVILTETIGVAGFPQILMRMGYGPNVKATPRREVNEVLIVDSTE